MDARRKRSGCVCDSRVHCKFVILLKMLDYEAIQIEGTIRYANYSGYADSFACEGPFTELQEENNIILAIDALHFRTA